MFLQPGAAALAPAPRQFGSVGCAHHSIVHKTRPSPGAAAAAAVHTHSFTPHRQECSFQVTFHRLSTACKTSCLFPGL